MKPRILTLGQTLTTFHVTPVHLRLRAPHAFATRRIVCNWPTPGGLTVSIRKVGCDLDPFLLRTLRLRTVHYRQDEAILIEGTYNGHVPPGYAAHFPFYLSFAFVLS